MSYLSSISCLYFLTLTTPVQAILQVLRKLKVPQLLIEITEITYRFIFVFLETALKIYQAQNSRLGYRTFKLWLHSLGLLISSLFITVFQRAKELTIAMDSRGYAGEILYLDEHYQYSAKLAHYHWNYRWYYHCLSTVWRKLIMDEVLFEIHQLTYRFADGTTGLKNIYLSIHKGKKIALLGNNGAGKSTLFQHLNGIFNQHLEQFFLKENP